MKTKLRKATPADAKAFLYTKDQLPLAINGTNTTTGGFLLGTDEATYLDYINTSYCLVAEENNKVIGFGIIFPDGKLRESDVWVRRHSATWHIDLAQYELQQLCYFEQFAFLTGHKRAAVALAYHITSWAFAMGHETLFATTVNEPVRNLAAIPFVNAANGIKAGNINETYPIIGHINSDIHLVEASNFYERAKAHPLYSFVQSQTIDLS